MKAKRPRTSPAKRAAEEKLGCPIRVYLMRAHKEGVRRSVMCARLGVSRVTVLKWLDDYGLTP